MTTSEVKLDSVGDRSPETDPRQTAHMWPDDSDAAGGVRSVEILVPGSADRRLTYRRLDGPLDPAAGSDPFVLGTLLSFMQWGVDVHVHGTVSARLLRGVEELQGIWTLWRPDLYQRVTITADQVTPGFPSDGPAISAFSGGVDAAYTVMRHAMGLAGADRADLQAVLMVHGFDIHRDADEVFASALRRATSQLDGTGLGIVPVWTNLRELEANWEHIFGLAVASCLSLVQPAFSVGLIGSSKPYDSWQTVPWGSSPITDHLYSTGAMDIRHDGAIASRTEKARRIATWPKGAKYLRVCWEGVEQDSNCGRCEKCVRTQLNFLAGGAEVPGCFDHQASPDDIRSVVARNAPQLAELRSASSLAHGIDATGEWLNALDEAIRLNQHRLAAQRLRAALKARVPRPIAGMITSAKRSLRKRSPF